MTALRQHQLLPALLLACSIGGCAGFAGSSLFGASSADTSLNGSPNGTGAPEKSVFWGGYESVAWEILDPLAPNWEIEQARFPDAHYHLSLKMKRFYSGGAGEARMVFHRRAKDLMRENGFDAYLILEYTEGLDSSALASQRVAQGVIQLSRR